MKKPMSLVRGFFGGALASALVWGCGLTTEGGEFFEMVEEGDASVAEHDAGGKRDAGSTSKDASTDAEAGADAATDASPGDGGSDGSPDAEPEEDAGPDGSDDLDAAPPDDADAADPDAGEAGSICCEGDPNVFPGQTAFFTVPNKCGNFDYDCDGVEEKELGLGKACSRPAFSGGCNAHVEGFKNKVPECGQPGIKFIGCTARTWNGGCESVEDAVLQGCR